MVEEELEGRHCSQEGKVSIYLEDTSVIYRLIICCLYLSFLDYCSLTVPCYFD